MVENQSFAHLIGKHVKLRVAPDMPDLDHYRERVYVVTQIVEGLAIIRTYDGEDTATNPNALIVL